MLETNLVISPKVSLGTQLHLSGLLKDLYVVSHSATGEVIESFIVSLSVCLVN